MKSLVIAEKPSVARDIARVLHCTQKGNGILEGKEYVVTWALGHLVTLADPEEYDKKYMKWDMETLPMMPDKMKLVVIRQTSNQPVCLCSGNCRTIKIIIISAVFQIVKSVTNCFIGY